ncbi:MAG: citrate/2-methylcitrate synthase [Desulfoferrobacter sp.]
MESSARLKNIGLRGVSVADTKISYIDGQKGILLYRGFRIEELAAKSSFIETAYLLLNGSLPKAKDLRAFSNEMLAGRQLPGFIHDSLKGWPKHADSMDILQASIPLLAMADPELGNETRDANVRKAIRLLARIPSVIAAWQRIRQDHEPLPPKEDLPHAANFLWQLIGQQPDSEMAHDLDVSLILQAEHTFNASTFACREVVSTRAHMYAGVAAGVGALSGSLHGGANARAMELLLHLEEKGKSEKDMAAWVRQQIDSGERIMGMGHPVYKTFDPRAEILKKIAERLAAKAANENRYKMLARIEEEAVKEFERRGKRGIKANVDFYSGLVYSSMGIPLDLMTPLFVMALSTGWCAHIIEEKFAEAQGKPALYRPQAEYVGDYCGPVGCVYQPIDNR